MQLCRYLDEHRIPFERVVHPPAFTAQKRAHVLHVSGRQVLKSVLLRTPQQYFLAVLPAVQQVDTDALSTRCGERVRLADLREVTTLFRDCECGAVPPFGTLYGLRTILENTVGPEDMMVCEGQTLCESIRLRCRDFEDLERPVRLVFSMPTRNAHTTTRR